MRKNKWKIVKTGIELMEEILSHLEWANLVEITKLIGIQICESDENLMEFINLLWKLVVHNTQSLKEYARLVQGLSFINPKMQIFLFQFMTKRNKTFCSIPLQNFSPAISKKLATIIYFMCYLYVIDVATESDLEMWIRPNLVQHLTMSQNTELSIILSTKVSACSNVNVKAFFTFVEYNVKEQLLSVFNQVKNDLRDTI